MAKNTVVRGGAIQRGNTFSNLMSRGIAGLGSMVGKGISAYTGAATRGAASLGSSAGRGLAGLVGGQGGGSFTKVIPGTPQPQPGPTGRSQGSQGSQGSYFNSWGSPGLPPRRPDPASSSGGGGGGGGGMNPYALQWAQADRATAAMERRRIKEANAGNVSAYNKAFAEAKLGNETRYQQLLDIANSTTTQRAKDIGVDYGQREADSMQNLRRLGMGNTTIAPTLGMGFGRQKNAALDRLADQMQGTKLGIIERRTDAYPDLASLMSLGQMGIGGLKF